MPLLDHFHPPLSLDRPWEGVLSTWVTSLAAQLNQGLLPADYVALPHATAGGEVEVDGRSLQHGAAQGAPEAEADLPDWAPPPAPLAAHVDFVHPDVFEVQVVQQLAGRRLRAVLALVSPANKDRAGRRQAFAVRCAAYLQRATSVLVVDVVTEPAANLHAEIARMLGLADVLVWKPASGLYAVSYSTEPATGQYLLEAWPAALAVGAALPTLPLWLAEDFCVPLNLEDSYRATCASLRLPA